MLQTLPSGSTDHSTPTGRSCRSISEPPTSSITTWTRLVYRNTPSIASICACVVGRIVRRHERSGSFMRGKK